MQHPELDITGKVYTYREWLTHYLNLWQRQLIARIVDVQTDTMRKAVNPNEQVSDSPDEEPTPVKDRLELRKVQVEEAKKIIAGIKALIEIPDSEFESKTMSKEALAISADMVPRKYKFIKQYGQHAAGTIVEMPPVDGQVLVDLGTLEAVPATEVAPVAHTVQAEQNAPAAEATKSEQAAPVEAKA